MFSRESKKVSINSYIILKEEECGNYHFKYGDSFHSNILGVN